MVKRKSAKGAAKLNETIQWIDMVTGKLRIGTVRKILDNSVIVDIPGTDDSTVVNHKRYKVLKNEAGAAT